MKSGRSANNAAEKEVVVRPQWQGSKSQERDARKRRTPGSRLLGKLPLPQAVDRAMLTLDEQPVALTHLNKVMFPDSDLRKRDLLDYAHDVSEFLLPHMLDRPLSLKRYPHGIAGMSFFQKEAGAAMPAWVRTTAIGSQGERASINYVICDDCPTLLYLVNLGCIDHHCWMSRATTPEAPDYVLLDLDPGPRAGFDTVIRVATAVRKVLDDWEVLGFPKTSGATGMHVLVPLGPGHTYQQSARFAELILRAVAERLPDLTTLVWAVKQRPSDRVYLDYRQNARGKTIPPAYSPRPLPGAPVSTPLRWSEVRSGLDPASFTVATVRRRLERHGDLAAGALPHADGPQLQNLLDRIVAMVPAVPQRARAPLAPS